MTRKSNQTPCRCGCGRWATRPTDTLPHTPERIAVMAGRRKRGECLWHPLDAGFLERAAYLGLKDPAGNPLLRAVVDEVHYGLQKPGANGRGTLTRPWVLSDGKGTLDVDDVEEPTKEMDATARICGALVLHKASWRSKMDRKKARQLASKARPCPFCNERLVVRDDHHGCWVAHKDEIGGTCIVSVIQLLSDEDLEAWNRRGE